MCRNRPRTPNAVAILGRKHALSQPLPPTPSPQRRGGASNTLSLLLPLSVAGRGLGGGVSYKASERHTPKFERIAVATTATHRGGQRPAHARPRFVRGVPDPPQRGAALLRRLLGLSRRQGRSAR